MSLFMFLKCCRCKGVPHINGRNDRVVSIAESIELFFLVDQIKYELMA